MKSHFSFQCDLGMALACIPVVDSIRSSYEKWNCGMTEPVLSLKRSATDEACLGKGPAMSPYYYLLCTVH